MKTFWALLKARNIEFVRDRSTLAWNLVFPFLIIFGFALIFSESSRNLYKVGVFNMTPQQIHQSKLSIFQTDYIEFIPISDKASALVKVNRHKLDMVIESNEINQYWINNTNPKGYVLERILWGAENNHQFKKIELEGREIRYVDWVFPGVLGMNMMFSCLFGVGYVIVRYRKAQILRRLKASPINAFQFLASQVVSRLIIVMLTTVILYLGSDIFLDLYVIGSLVDLFIIFMIGSFCMISLGLLVSCKTHSQELAGGLLNFLTWPMMFLSGVWFSLEGTNVIVQKLALIFPLTHLLNAIRKIAIDGHSLIQVYPEMLSLTLSSFVFMAISAYFFRWE